MTETEWDGCTSYLRRLGYLHRQGSDRKWRLFACACCRRVWDRFPDPCNRDLVTAVEKHVDGDLEDQALEETLVASSAREWEFHDQPGFWFAKDLGRGYYKATPSQSAIGVAVRILVLAGREHRREAEEAGQAALFADIFGNPFRPPAPLPAGMLAWNDGTVRRIAQAVYEERSLPEGTLDGERLAVLADALEDAGLTDKQVLGHLRRPGGVHVRGCFVVDLMLGKS
jgi:hypothetical protein